MSSIEQGDPNIWIRVFDRKTGRGWDVSPEWLKQHLDICDLKSVLRAQETRIDGLELIVLKQLRALFIATLKLHFKHKGEINTRELNKFIDNFGLKLENKAMMQAFVSLVADGTLTFKKQGKGHPRLWFLEES